MSDDRDYAEEAANRADVEREHAEEMSCLDRSMGDAEPCVGAVELRDALSPTGRMFPRCDKHWKQRLDEQQGINERYPDSPMAPAGFDPAYAGESWEDY
jgi:hypothetical protein